jgi:putative transposase
MSPYFAGILLFLSSFFRSRYHLGLEIISLRQQWGVLNRKHTSPSSPWQNGIAERWIGNCRRELLDHVIVLGQDHLHRLVRNYVTYYHTDRTHDTLEKDAPRRRSVTSRPGPSASLISSPRVGGLHHRYDWRQAA